MRASVSYVRTRGLSIDSASGLREHLSKVSPELLDETLATELETFVRESSASARPDECLVGWQHGGAGVVIRKVEDLGWKTLERQESQSGITGLTLSLGALAIVPHPNRLRSHPREACPPASAKKTFPPAYNPNAVPPCRTRKRKQNPSDLPLQAIPTVAHPRGGPRLRQSCYFVSN